MVYKTAEAGKRKKMIEKR